ncbi:MAG: acetyl-CoA carboxylase biotin carboxyl carrier protein [Chloroherpetonaceae bacterium]|nr:acetyl-CoA carboxylase biotin carboxyl carrier protein [Chloroherpetonaceae bacterium]
MNLEDIKQLIKMLDESGLDEMGIQDGEFKINLKRKTDLPAASQASVQYAYPAPYQNAPAPSAGSLAAASAPEPQKTDGAKKYREVRSPMVGTFYRSPAPDANPYVQVGDKVSKGKVLCIIEAMKLMNEIESDIDGSVVQIMVENGKPVEYNQVLFLID